MKKRSRWMAFFLMLLLAFSPVSAFAAEIKNPTPFTITSGLDLNAEVRETTFERCRLVYGEAEPNTEITVSVGRLDSADELVVAYEETLTVGSLGMFSLNLPLEMGTNYITLTAKAEGYDAVSYEVRMKRYSQQVKKELQKIVVLPSSTGTWRAS